MCLTELQRFVSSWAVLLILTVHPQNLQREGKIRPSAVGVDGTPTDGDSSRGQFKTFLATLNIFSTFRV